MRPSKLSPLNHAAHSSICFCISSGDPDVFLPRKRYVNSLMAFLPFNSTIVVRFFGRRARGVVRGAVLGADRNDNQSMWGPFSRNKRGRVGISVWSQRDVRTEVSIGQVR